MIVMLINSTSRLAESSKIYKRSIAAYLPTGLAYLASVLRDKGHTVIVEDQSATGSTNKEVIHRIKERKPDLIGFSCLTPVMSNVKILVKEIKGINKDTKIVFGNIHATIFGEELLKEGLADVIVSGEGELSLLEVAQSLETKKGLDQVRGISFSDAGKITRNAPRPPIENLDSLPYPAWDVFDFKYYKKYPMLGINNEVILPVQGSRGCPYQCIFCSQDKIHKKPRYRSTKQIIEEIGYMYDKYNHRFFGFNDPYLPFSIKHGFEFCDELIKSKLHKKIKWLTETRVDLVNLELLERMKEAGLDMIMYGFEVGNQKILDSIGKKATIEQARKAMQATKKSGVRSLGLFILGLPGETKETCEETIKFAKQIDCDMAKFNIAVPFPGSSFFEEYRNRLDNINDLDKFTSWYDWSRQGGELIFVPEGMTSRQLIILQRRAMLGFYLRPKIIFRHLARGTFSPMDLFYGVGMLIQMAARNIRDYLRSKFKSCA